jgi:hypothetical protein
MIDWTPEAVFILTYIAASLSGLAALLRTNQPLTVRSVLGTVLFYGSAGCGLGMVSYEYLGGKNAPWRVIGCGMLVGIKVIQLKDISNLVRRLFGETNDKDKEKG